ncbi:MAG: GAF domain-containing protein [Fimbriimonadaceae bacterium]|nr:GAF domain-containing protein [Fimbriimonadaceae bacterium]
MDLDAVAGGAGQLAEDRLRSLWELHQRPFQSERELVNHAIEEAVRLTGSTMGFFHYFHPVEQQIELFTWSAEVRQTCSAPNPGMYALAEAGNWAAAARTGQPQVFNDYPHSPGRRGYPEGHSPVHRYMSAPVRDGGEVVLVAGVANKAEPYTQGDVQQLQLYLENVWRVLLRWRHERWLAAQNAALEATVAARTAELSATVAELTAARASDAARRQRLLALHGLQQELSRLRGWDELLQTAVERGRAVLGIDRLSVWLLDDDGQHIWGTWGTDEAGQTRDERGTRLVLTPQTAMGQVVAGRQRLLVVPGTVLTDHQKNVVGHGDSVVAPLWDGGEVLGCMAADNLLRGQAGEVADYEPLELYATSLGHLLTRLRAEKALSESERRLREAHSIAQIGTFQVDLQGTDCWWSPECYNLFAVDPADGQPSASAVAAMLHPADRERLHQAGAESLRSGQAVELLVRVRRADGQARQHRVWVTGSADQAGQLRLLAGTAQDITERQAAAEALLAEKERLAVTLRSIGDGVIATDPEGRVVLLNRVAEELLGWEQDAAAGRPLAELVGEDWLCPVAAVEPAAPLETEWRRPSGDMRRMTRCVSPIRRTTGPVLGAVVVIRDVTLERRLQAALQMAAKLDSLGVLAGGIAHDFNNLLATMVGNADLARLALADGDTGEVREALTDIAAAGVQARGLTQQLLTFARGSTPVRSSLALEPLTRQAAGFALHGSHCRPLVTASADLPPVEADPGQLEQVVHNLLLNAAEAMPGGGAIAVHLAPATPDELTALPLPAGAYVVMRVADQGCGMSAEVLARIFDPYFTTKPQGHGLGLASSYSIVRAHGGYLAVTSTVGQGSCFRVYLPAADRPPAAAAAEPPVVASRCLRVLVLDDQEPVRRMLERLLQQAGHTVVSVGDGATAVGSWRAALAGGTAFDVGIFDLTLPGGQSGQETLAAIRQWDPAARVVASSGYALAPVMADYAAYGFCDRLVKPYRLAALVEVLSRIAPRAASHAAPPG